MAADLSGKQIDHYRLISKQGLGGMAVVYQAYDVNLERDVALKLIRADAFPEDDHGRLMKRFEREAKSQSRFSHPNIVQVYDYGEFEEMPYLVMPYYSEGTLKERIGQSPGLDQVFEWVIQIADALVYAHQRKVVHRDVKPSNILFDEKGTPILTDFGIAKLLEESEGTLTDTGFGIGTPEYMAPEQWQGESSESSDQYALGVVLYELLTGRKPYEADTPVAVALKQLSDPLIRPSAIVAAIPDEVEKILYKVLATAPADRYGSMEKFQNALRTIKPELRSLSEDKQKRIDTGEITISTIEATSVHSEAQTVDLFDPLPNAVIETTEQIQGKENALRKRRKLFRLLAGFGVLIAIVLLAVWQFFPDVFSSQASRAPESATSMVADDDQALSQNNQTASPAATLAPTSTDDIQPTLTLTTTLSPTDAFGVVDIRLRELDGMEMVFVPAGEFIFGTNRGSTDHGGVAAQFSTWDVYLDAFWVDRYEVTNGQYALCVEAGVCTEPYRSHSNTRYGYYFNDDYSNYPVINVDRYKASVYCEWVGGRLPTEAEWEKAARGTDGREYPWGNYWSTEKPGNFDDYQGIDSNYEGDTTPVGSFPEGASPYGAMDMLGNVWEWVADWYHPAIFATEPVDNPTGPKHGEFRLIRGGSYRMGISLLAREIYPYSWMVGLEQIGFRCVMDVDEEAGR